MWLNMLALFDPPNVDILLPGPHSIRFEANPSLAIFGASSEWSELSQFTVGVSGTDLEDLGLQGSSPILIP